MVIFIGIGFADTIVVTKKQLAISKHFNAGNALNFLSVLLILSLYFSLEISVTNDRPEAGVACYKLAIVSSS